MKNNHSRFNLLWFLRSSVIAKFRNSKLSKSHSTWIKDEVSEKIVLESDMQDKYWIGAVTKTNQENVLGYIQEGIHGESVFQNTYTEIFLYAQFHGNSIVTEELAYQQALDVINKFIYCYRVLTSDTDVYVLKAGDLEYVNYLEVMDEHFDIYQQKSKDGKVRLKPVGKKLDWSGIDPNRLHVPNFGEDIVENIENKIQLNYKAPLWFEILLDAKSQNSSYQRYDLSVALMQTSFEVFVDVRLKGLLEEKGTISVDEIERRLSDGFMNKLKQQLSKLLDKPIREGIREFDGWKKCLYDVRNDVAHRGVRELDKQDVQRAFSAVVRFMNYLDANVHLT